MSIEIISTERLALRTVSHSDFEMLYDLVFSAPEVMAKAFAGITFSREQAKVFMFDHFDWDGNGMQLAPLVLKESNSLIGFAGLLHSSVLNSNDYEFGFVLGKKFWGRGYATEIGLAQIEYGINIKGCKRLLAQVSPDNKASIAVLEKFGMTHHSTLETNSRGRREIYVIDA